MRGRGDTRPLKAPSLPAGRLRLPDERPREAAEERPKGRRQAPVVTWCRWSEGKAEPAAAAAEIGLAPPVLPRPPGAPARPARAVPPAGARPWTGTTAPALAPHGFPVPHPLRLLRWLCRCSCPGLCPPGGPRPRRPPQQREALGSCECRMPANRAAEQLGVVFPFACRFPMGFPKALAG